MFYQPDVDFDNDFKIVGNYPEISPPKKVWVIPNEEKKFSFTLQTLENVETIIKGKNYTSTTWYFPLKKGEKYTMQVSLKLGINGKEEIFYSNKVTFRYK